MGLTPSSYQLPTYVFLMRTKYSKAPRFSQMMFS